MESLKTKSRGRTERSDHGAPCPRVPRLVAFGKSCHRAWVIGQRPLGCLLGSLRKPLGNLFFGVRFGPPGGLMGPLGGRLGGLLAVSGVRSEGGLKISIRDSPLRPLLRPSWSRLGRSWVPFRLSWSPLGSSWGSLGDLLPSWGNLAGLFGHCKSPQSEYARNVRFPQGWDDVCLLGPSWGPLRASWGLLGSSWGPLGASEGLLGPPGGL